MAVDMYLKLAGCEGEATEPEHKDEIKVLAFSWGMSQSGSSQLSGGAGAGRVNVQDLSVTKFLDKASANIAKKCCMGTHFDEGILTLRKAGGDAGPIEYYVITMKKILITSVSSGASGGEDSMTENVTLNFAEYKTEYTPQLDDGSAAAVIEGSWNIRENHE